MPRRPLLAALVAAAAALAGCGGEDERRAAPVPEPVVLAVSAPVDEALVREETVEVSGSVEPAGASVRVLGQPAAVSAGSFSASVPLEPGANVIDVVATAGEREPALSAVRVIREVPVEVPDLDGLEVEAAQEAVDGAGLELAVERGDGLLDDILPGEPAVCEQDPEPDTLVRPGSLVRVRVAENC